MQRLQKLYDDNANSSASKAKAETKKQEVEQHLNKIEQVNQSVDNH